MTVRLQTITEKEEESYGCYVCQGYFHLIAKSVEKLEMFKIRPYHNLLNPIKTDKPNIVIINFKQQLSKLTFD